MVEADTQMVINAADERPEDPQRNGVTWPFLIEWFGDEDMLFWLICLNRPVEKWSQPQVPLKEAIDSVSRRFNGIMSI